MKKIDLSKLPKVEKGYKRQWYVCKCGEIMYMDFVPYSLSNPILETPCGHTFNVMNMKRIDESEISI